MSVDFSKVILSLRKRLGLSQKAFAKRVGIHAVTIARWETKRIHPSLESMRQVADKCGLNLSDVIGEDQLSSHPELLREGIPDQAGEMFLELLKALQENPVVLKAAIMATPGVEECVKRAQERSTQGKHMPPTGQGHVPSESARVNLSELDAADLLVWIDQRMRDLKSTDSMREPLQRLSQELGRLCAPEVRQSRQAAKQPRVDSAESRKSAGTTDGKHLDKSADQSSVIPVAKVPK